jgi:hypothetical protein
MARDKFEFLKGKLRLAAAICLASSLVVTGSLPAMANGATVTEIDVVWPGFDPALTPGQQKTPTGEVEITVKISGATSFDSFFLELQQTWSGGPNPSDQQTLGSDGKCMVNEVHLYTVVATPPFAGDVSCYVFGYQMDQADPTDKYGGPQLQSTSAQELPITELKFTFPSGTLRQVSTNDFTVGVSFNGNYVASVGPNSQFREPSPQEPVSQPLPFGNELVTAPTPNYFIAVGFDKGKAKLKKSMRAFIRKELNSRSGEVRAVCVGTVRGKKWTPKREALALARAASGCDYVTKLNPGLPVELKKRLIAKGKGNPLTVRIRVFY